MGEKNWVDTEDFATAWLVALAMHGVKASGKVVRAAVADAVAGYHQQDSRNNGHVGLRRAGATEGAAEAGEAAWPGAPPRAARTPSGGAAAA
jgi:hypothetical protein